MPCNFLFRLDTEDKYQHTIFDGCHGSTARSAATGFWRKKFPKVTVSNFEANKETFCPWVWAKYIEGVSVVEEKYEIQIGEVIMPKDPSLPMNDSNNYLKGTSLVLKLVETKPLQLLDIFKDDVQ